MASLRPPESHGSGPPPRNHGVSFTSFAADDLTLAQSPPPKSPTVSATQKRYPYCWSKLVPDLLQMVFERLGFADLKRAKSVCSSWQSASRNCQPNNQIPWMIRFPKKSNYCLLFNPEEKDQIYKTQNLGDDFAKSVCVAMYRSWLLMQPRFKYIEDDLQWNLYILDLLTRERINLPGFVSNYGVSSPILWIDEKTKDHLVIGLVDEEYTIICFKKGDKSWKQIPSLYECFSMVYKDRKLYCLDHHKLKILDFSQEIPQQVFKISVRGCVPLEIGPCIRLPGIPTTDQMSHLKNDLVVTVSGHVLIVESRRPSMSKIWKFEIYKMDSSKGSKWEKIVSMGDEAILLDLGVTVVAKDMEGIQSNSIYFSNATPHYEDQYDKNEIFIFKLDSKKVEQPHRSVCSSFPCSRARWFLPSFKRE